VPARSSAHLDPREPPESQETMESPVWLELQEPQAAVLKEVTRELPHRLAPSVHLDLQVFPATRASVDPVERREARARQDPQAATDNPARRDPRENSVCPETRDRPDHEELPERTVSATPRVPQDPRERLDHQEPSERRVCPESAETMPSQDHQAQLDPQDHPERRARTEFPVFQDPVDTLAPMPSTAHAQNDQAEVRPLLPEATVVLLTAVELLLLPLVEVLLPPLGLELLLLLQLEVAVEPLAHTPRKLPPPLPTHHRSSSRAERLEPATEDHRVVWPPTASWPRPRLSDADTFKHKR